MAKYDYRCPGCGHTEERTFTLGTAPEYTEDDCPNAHNGARYHMKKVILPAAVSFKGSGFYKTDNRKTNHVKSSIKVGGNQ